MREKGHQASGGRRQSPPEQGLEALPLPPADLEYCWNKLLLFDRLPFEGKGLYFDLDVVIAGDLTPIATARPGDAFVGVVDWNRPRDPQYDASVMELDLNGHQRIVDEFRRRVAGGRLVKKREWDACLGRLDEVVCRDGDIRYGGDRVGTSRLVYPRAELASHMFPPGTALSCETRGRRRLPAGCRVMVFRGDPKPRQVDVAYARQHWRQRASMSGVTGLAAPARRRPRR